MSDGNPFGATLQEGSRIANITAQRMLGYPDFFRVAGRQQSGDIDFSDGGDSDEPANMNVEKLIRETPIGMANSVSSRLAQPEILLGEKHDQAVQLHNLVIDLDHDAVLIATTTPGHHHLIVNRPMTWERYVLVLDALLLAGLIQEGYHHACLNRGASWIRTPWTRKEASSGEL